MEGILNLALSLFTFVVVGIGIILSGPKGIAPTLIAWLSFIPSLKYGNSVDVRVGYMSVLAWILAMGDVFISRVFNEQLELREFLALSNLPPVVLLLLLNSHEYLGIMALLCIMLLKDNSIAKSLPQNLFNRSTVKFLLILQVVFIYLSTNSPYALPYALVLWWWYKLTIGGHKAVNS